MSIGERIKTEREKRGMSQRALSKSSGISQPTISAIESSTKSPSTETIRLIANALGCPLSYLLEEEPEHNLNEMEETLYRRPGMRVLFDAVKDAPDEVLQQTIDIIEVLKNGKKR